MATYSNVIHERFTADGVICQHSSWVGGAGQTSPCPGYTTIGNTPYGELRWYKVDGYYDNPVQGGEVIGHEGFSSPGIPGGSNILGSYIGVYPERPFALTEADIRIRSRMRLSTACSMYLELYSAVGARIGYIWAEIVDDSVQTGPSELKSYGNKFIVLYTKLEGVSQNIYHVNWVRVSLSRYIEEFYVSVERDRVYMGVGQGPSWSAALHPTLMAANVRGAYWEFGVIAHEYHYPLQLARLTDVYIDRVVMAPELDYFWTKKFNSSETPL